MSREAHRRCSIQRFLCEPEGRLRFDVLLPQIIGDTFESQCLVREVSLRVRDGRHLSFWRPCCGGGNARRTRFSAASLRSMTLCVTARSALSKEPSGTPSELEASASSTSLKDGRKGKGKRNRGRQRSSLHVTGITWFSKCGSRQQPEAAAPFARLSVENA